MSQLRILSCGPATMVQDAGRIGAQRFGISESGVMDVDAYRIANALVSADENAAVMELAGTGGTFSADERTLVAYTGASCRIDVDGAPQEPWTSFWLEAGAALSIGPLREATYGFLALGRGIDVPPVLGSRSTHSRSAVGGYRGRSLQRGDTVPFIPSGLGECARRLTAVPKRKADPIRVVAGPQDDYFDAENWELFLSAPFTVTVRKDRMGMILDGPKLEHAKGYNIVSDAIAFGSVQVPGSGKPIVLLADRQSTGGYPKIATVISCDLGRLAQTLPGDEIRFALVGIEEAEELARAARSRLDTLIGHLEAVPSDIDLSSARLLGLNLVGGVCDAKAKEDRRGKASFDIA